MKLQEWMKIEGLNDTDLAKRFGHGRTDTVRRWKSGECIPRKREMKKLHKISNGQITANDFYDIQ